MFLTHSLSVFLLFSLEFRSSWRRAGRFGKSCDSIRFYVHPNSQSLTREPGALHSELVPVLEPPNATIVSADASSRPPRRLDVEVVPASEAQSQATASSSRPKMVQVAGGQLCPKNGSCSYSHMYPRL